MSLLLRLAPLTCLLLLLSHGQAFSQTAGQSCVAAGTTLGTASSAYQQQCALPRVDCDPINGQWYCASYQITSSNRAATTNLATPFSTSAGNLPGNPQSSMSSGITIPAGDAPPPVASPSAGRSNGRPICLSDASDPNGSGYGFENNQSCIVVAGVTATRNQPLLNQRVCAPWFEISYGNYKLQNNTWNEAAAFSNNWSQCIELNRTNGNYVARWDYNWLPREVGNEYAVKSYPQVYYGRKTAFNISGTVEQTGLPVLTDNMQQIWVEYDYSETGQTERNVALESFFHTSCEANDNNKQFEMMVWVGVPAIRTPGVLVTSVTLSGQQWDVYTNPTLSWAYVAFVARQPSNSGTLDWNSFVNWSRSNGPAYGVPAMANNTCMGAIEIGTETFWGTGTFTLNRFNVNSAH